MTEKDYITASRLRSEKCQLETLRSRLEKTRHVKLITAETEYTYSRANECKIIPATEGALTECIVFAVTKAIDDRLEAIEKEFEAL